MSPVEQLKQRKILFLMTGSIAAFKACGLISKLKQFGHEVRVAASPSALHFVGLPTLEGLSGQTVMTDLWEEGRAMDHIHAVRWADLIVVAPASEHFINRIAHGLGDDLLSTMFLAHDFKKPFLIAPAMNTSMYLHPATQNSLQRLKTWGVEILESASGVLACGEQGYGRLLEVDQLLEEVQQRLKNLPQSSQKSEVQASAKTSTKTSMPKILVTAGGTVEPLDEVRFIGNESSGRTGFLVAAALRDLGADVTLLASSSARERFESMFPGLSVRTYRRFSDLASLMEEELRQNSFTHLVHAAAVSDYRVKAVRVDGQELIERKLPSGRNLSLELEPNPKLIDLAKAWSQSPNLTVLGFKLTRGLGDRQRVEEKVRDLFAHSQANYVVHNDQTQLDHTRERHPFQIFSSNLEIQAHGESSNELVQAISRIVFQEAP